MLNPFLAKLSVVHLLLGLFLSSCAEDSSEVAAESTNGPSYRADLVCDDGLKPVASGEVHGDMDELTITDMSGLSANSTCAIGLYSSETLDKDELHWLADLGEQKIESLLYRSKNFELTENPSEVIRMVLIESLDRLNQDASERQETNLVGLNGLPQESRKSAYLGDNHIDIQGSVEPLFGCYKADSKTGYWALIDGYGREACLGNGLNWASGLEGVRASGH